MHQVKALVHHVPPRGGEFRVQLPMESHVLRSWHQKLFVRSCGGWLFHHGYEWLEFINWLQRPLFEPWTVSWCFQAIFFQSDNFRFFQNLIRLDPNTFDSWHSWRLDNLLILLEVFQINFCHFFIELRLVKFILDPEWIFLICWGKILHVDDTLLILSFW